MDQPTLAAALRDATSHASKLGGETFGLLRKIADLEAEVSRLRKAVVPFSWNAISITFTQGTASSVNLATFLRNPDNRTITYSIIGTLPSGVVLSGAVVSYNGTGAAANAQVQFRATSGSFTAESAATSVSIQVVQVANRPPVWATIPNQTTASGTALTANLWNYASDPDGNSLVFGRTGGVLDTAPAGITVSSAGVLSVPSNTPAGTYTVEAFADDQVIGFSGYITSATTVIPLPALSKPAAGASYVDPNFNTTVTRITNPAALVSETSAGSNYSQQQHWNSDESLMMIYGGSGYPYIIDAVAPYTVRTGRMAAPYPGDTLAGTWKWSTNQPREIYYFGRTHSAAPGVNWGAFTPHDGAVFVKVTIATNFSLTYTVVASWPGYWANKNPCSEELKSGPDGKLWVGVCLQDSSAQTNATKYYAFGHNVTDNVDTGWLDCAATAGQAEYPPGNFYYRQPDNVTMTPKCDGVIVVWGSGTGRYQGKELHSLVPAGGNLNSGFIKQIEPTAGHHDSFQDSAGDSWMVYANGPDVTLRKGAIDGATQSLTALINLPYPGPSGGEHISARQNNGAQDWAVISPYYPSGGNWVSMRDEIVMVYEDSTLATPHILRLCHHRGTYGGYGGSPFATVNRSGTKVLFNSNWSGSGTYDGFVVDVPSASAPATSAIETAAAALSSKQWSAANVVGASTVNLSSKYGRSPFVAIDATQSAGRNILDWPGKAVWDSTGQKLWFCGGGINTDGLQTQTMTLTSYDPASDSFTPYQGNTKFTTGLWHPKSEAHSFDGFDLDINRRKAYRAIFTNTGPEYGGGIGTFSLTTPTDTGNSFTSVAQNILDYGSLVAFPDRNSVLVFRNGSTIREFNADTLTQSATYTSGVSVTYCLAMYHSGKVYFSRGNAGTEMYRMDAVGTITQLASSCPVAMHIDYNCVWGKLGSYIYAFHRDGNIYRFNVATETWDASPYSTIPSSVYGTAGTGGAISASTGGGIPFASGGGVFLWIVATNEQAIKSYLWKP